MDILQETLLLLDFVIGVDAELSGVRLAHLVQENLGPLLSETEQLFGNGLDLLLQSLLDFLALFDLGVHLELEKEELFVEQVGLVPETEYLLVLFSSLGFELVLFDFQEGRLSLDFLKVTNTSK